MNERDLPVGRELDALVAEKVMGFQWLMNGNLREPKRAALHAPDLARSAKQRGWVPSTVTERYSDWDDELLPHYSTDLRAAWQVVEALHVRGECVDLAYVDSLHEGMGWQVEFRMTGTWAFAKTPAHAICRAALIAACRLGEAQDTSCLDDGR